MKTIYTIMAVVALGASLNAATVATVNGKAIDEQDLLPIIQQVSRGQYAQLPQSSKEQVQKIALDQLVGQILIQEQAQKSGIDKTDAYKQALKDTLKRIEPQLSAEVWLQQEFEKVSVTAKEVKAFYEKNRDEFEQPKEVHARHILLKEEAQAKDVIKELKSLKGQALQAKFIELAKAKSTGPSGPKGGDLGYFQEGQMVPEFNDEVFSMQTGTITQKPVKTKFGYHVIYLEDVRGGMKPSFDEVKAQAEQALKTEIFQKDLKERMDKLKQKANISFN